MSQCRPTRVPGRSGRERGNHFRMDGVARGGRSIESRSGQGRVGTGSGGRVFAKRARAGGLIGMAQQLRLSSARTRSRRAHSIPELPGPIPSEFLEPTRGDEVGEEDMRDRLDRRERLRLVEFVCSFAWADFEIQPEEREFIAGLIRRLDLDADERRQVDLWLERPPRIENLDPTAIPAAHRRHFVEAIEGLIAADGAVQEEERDTFEIFKQLLVE